MDLLKDDIKKLYYKYLSASLISALIGALYSIVDMIIIGQYQGSLGTAALAVVSPTYNLIFSLGLLFGIGGSVLYAEAKGEGKSNANEFFTVSFILIAAVSLAVWLLVLFDLDGLFRLFGGDGKTLPLAESYFLPIKWGVPILLFNQLLSCFLRNDKDPLIPTIATIVPCVLNIAGDYFFVFTCQMGMYGAGLATIICNGVSLVILAVHFLLKKNTLRLVKPSGFWKKAWQVVLNGFSPFFIDIAMGIVTVVFNNQIGRYMTDAELSVYGVIINISTIEQCIAYGIGQSAQPLISENYGAKQYGRIRKVLLQSLISCSVVAVVWTAVNMADPEGLLRLFMKPDQDVLNVTSGIFRRYSLAFIFLPFNVYSTYYFESVLKAKTSLLISVLRGLVLAVSFLYLLPLAFGSSAIWFAMPLTELLVFLLAGSLIFANNQKLQKEEKAQAVI
jgi:putative MATE family efflux protein